MDSNYDAEIYVDGSYNIKTKQYAYGMVVIDQKGIHCFNKAFSPDDKSSMRNVAGELAGAQAGMQYALDNNLKSVNMIYDYAGIEAWCTGSWRAKNQHTQSYKQFYDEASKKINIDFTHVKGHTGVEGNEICDSLAKYALNLPDEAGKREKYGHLIENAKPYVSLKDYQSKKARLAMADNLVSQEVESCECPEY